MSEQIMINIAKDNAENCVNTVLSKYMRKTKTTTKKTIQIWNQCMEKGLLANVWLIQATKKSYKNPIIKRIIAMAGEEYGDLKQFAVRADISYDLLRKNICCDETPKLEMLINISRAYGVSLDELCKDYETEHRFGGSV